MAAVPQYSKNQYLPALSGDVQIDLTSLVFCIFLIAWLIAHCSFDIPTLDVSQDQKLCVLKTKVTVNLPPT